ncbi:DUF1579 family protein [uncultured Cellulomonas sp.]|uniref:DUF1579 family protein n=1 Tax=uncultured Cellulomonas sp. TaxID=189682 RepID=UPI0028E53A28|nr:DUF1579 family protein [uncultured Cellulomonas sp.]
MSIVDHLAPLQGSWRGTNLLRLMPDDEYQSSAATASVGVTAVRFGSIAYTWSDGGSPQDGLLLLAGDATADGASAVWVDSFHTGPSWMTFSGGVVDGVLRLVGSYPAPPGPDWGWEIHVRPQDAVLTMHNVVPGHEPYQVVELALQPDGENDG